MVVTARRTITHCPRALRSLTHWQTSWPALASPTMSPSLPIRDATFPTRSTSLRNSASMSSSRPSTLHPDFPLKNDSSRRPSTQRSSSLHSSPSRSEQSGESLAWSGSEPDMDPPLTPNTDVNSDDGISGSALGHQDVAAEVDITKSHSKHASTKLLTTDPSILKESVDDSESGAQLIQKYCCGGGCCLSKLDPPLPPSSIHIELPDNDAYRSLNLSLGPLHEQSTLTGLADLPVKTVSILPISHATSPISASDSASIPSTDKHPPSFMKPHPPYDIHSAPLFHARALTGKEAEKATIHFDIDISDYPEEGGVDFLTGGAIGVCPSNYPEAVEDIFDVLGVPKFLRDKPIILKTSSGRWPTIWGEDEPRELVTTRRSILTWCSDIQSYAPTKTLLRLLGEHASAPNEKKVLLFLASAQGQPAFCNLRTGPFLSISQLLHAFPSSKPPFDELVSALPQLMPRFYSLSNDPQSSKQRPELKGKRVIEMAVSVAKRPNWRGGHHHGVGSGFMERVAKQFMNAYNAALERGLSVEEAREEAQKLDLRIPMFRGLMANPLSQKFGESKGPMMLVGAGVGMAPFRGFILNRLREANCANKIWLVQGVRDASVDELYSGELGKYEAQIKKVVQSRARRRPSGAKRAQTTGDITRLARDVEEAQNRWKQSSGESGSKYVQDELRQQADIVWDVIHHPEGRIFVCGSSKGMGEGVEEALRDVGVMKGLSVEASARFWEEAKTAGKYVAETW